MLFILFEATELIPGLVLISPLFYTLVSLALIIIILAYMFGITMGKSDWVALSKVELSELIKSVILFVIIVGFYSLINTLALSLFSSFFSIQIPKDADLVDLTILILRDAGISLQYKYITLLEMGHQMKLFGDASAKVGPGTLHIKLPIFVGTDLLFQSTEVLAYACLTGLHSVNAQIILFDLLKLLTVYLFFPVGLVLRLISNTREAGNELIATGITLSIILPFLYLFMFYITFDILKQHDVHGWVNPIYEEQSLTLKNKVLNSFEGIFHEIKKIAVLSTPFMVYIPINYLIVIKEIGWLLFFSFAIPTFAVILSTSLIRALMTFLDLDVALTFMG